MTPSSASTTPAPGTKAETLALLHAHAFPVPPLLYFTRARWTATDCKRLRKTAEERLAARAAAEQPQATQQEEDAVRTVPCPRTGERVAETVCNACGQRNGCPEWEA